MHAIERAEYILSMLEKNKVVMVTDLSREMGVTEETVRKDLEKLEKQEKLNRVHGGAYLNEGFGNETPISVRSKVMHLSAVPAAVWRQVLQIPPVKKQISVVRY